MILLRACRSIHALAIIIIIHRLGMVLLLTKRYETASANYDAVPQNIIRAIVDANSTRKDFLADMIKKTAKDRWCLSSRYEGRQ